MEASLDGELERWAREIRKGSARLALLKMLRARERYGYEILGEMRHLVTQGATEATVYPLLHGLEEKGFLRSRWQSSRDGVPPRKYYSITPSGAQLLDRMRLAWQTFRKEMDKVIRYS